MISRRTFSTSPGLEPPAPSGARASFPSALIRIIVPAAPGGGTDILARAMSAQLQTMWGQSVIVENRPGGAGLIGTRQVVGAPGDGHTLLMAATSAIMSLATHTAADPFDITRELAPVTLVSAPPYILVAHPSVPAKNAAELIAHAEEASRHAVLRLLRRRRGVASLGRAVCADGRHRHAARALSRHGTGGARPARRPHPAGVRAGDHRDARILRPARCG